MTVAIIGIDLGKTICSVVGLDAAGAVVLRRRMRRQTVIELGAGLSRCVFAMEACCGAHLMGRILADQGHEVRLMSPEYVRPYVKAQKNDDRDAEAIAEAASRPTMRFVELKSEAQLDMQTLHRVRQRLVGARRTLVNQLRAILFERGHAIAQGRRRLELAVEAMLADPDLALSGRMRTLVAEIRAEWRDLDRRIDALNAEFAARAREDDAARRLVTIPGIGVLNATALVAAVGDGSAFRRGRDLGAWLGLVPRQHTTGGKPKLLGITKRGNKYLRMLFIHGARASLPSLARSASPLGAWLRGLLATSPSSRSPTSSRASPGRCCAAVGASTSGTAPRRPDGRRHTTEYATTRAVLREGKGDGLTVDRRSGSLVQKTAQRCRDFYEDRDARSSILAAGAARETGYV